MALTQIISEPIFDHQLLEIIIVVFGGLVFGSFASAITYRVPRNLPWATKGKSEHGLRSACPHCKTLLKPRDLIPILSWVLSKGRCRYCDAAIPKTYPICEALTLAGCLGIYAVYGLTCLSLPFLVIIPFLVALLMIDFEHMILPNQLVAIVFALGAFVLLMRFVVTPDPQLLITYIGGAVLFGLFSWAIGALMTKLLKKEALGFGDVKFFAASGIWLGLPALGQFCIGAGVLGVIIGIIYQKVTKQPVFPFGPALIASFYGVLLLQGSHFL